MGTAIKPILKIENIKLDELKGKRIAVDAFNWLYQFLASVRQYDGTPLKDSQGRITSHLSGLFNRSLFLLRNRIQPIFVFDGKAPELKKKEQDIRAERKMKARMKLREAIDQHDIEAMKKYSAQTSKLTKEMIEDSKKLLDGLGIPWIQAPSEGEAQVAHLVKKGDAYCAASQDFDCLVFGAPRIVRNLNTTKKRKKSNSYSYEKQPYELINLSDNLNNLGIDQDQLIALSMLVGNDFFPSGIKGIGPKKGLDLVRKHKNNFKELFKEVEWADNTELGWKKVFDLIKDMPISEEYTITDKNSNLDIVKKILVEEHDFSEDRVQSALDKLKSHWEKQKQKSLSKWL